MQRRGAAFHPALPDVLATVRMNGQPAHGQRIYRRECPSPSLSPWPGPARRGKPSTNMKLAGTRVFTGVDAYLWPLGNSCSPYGGRFSCFSFASHHFSLSAHQHLAHEMFYVLLQIFLLLSRVCGHIHLRLNIIETRNTEGLSRLFRFIYFFWYEIDFRKILFFFPLERIGVCVLINTASFFCLDIFKKWV